jgi:hypothetical protein
MRLIDKLLLNIEEGYKANMINDDELVQILHHTADLLNLKSVSEIKKCSNLSYNGILKSPIYNKIQIGGKVFIIDNE